MTNHEVKHGTSQSHTVDNPFDASAPYCDAASEPVELLVDDVALSAAIELGLTEDEYHNVVAVQGRTPSITELYMYSLMWSEHCSYKHSKNELKKFPTSGEHVLQGPGENAGVVSVGDGWALAFKMESHNHPSAIEPYQGAATGVGGIVRDIFAMGARPVAALNSLRFGQLSDPRQRYLFEGAVAGIGGYGTCLGIPTIGGEVYFDDCYKGNCLVGAMALGLMREEELIHAVGSGAGNLVVLLGNTTGRDGIGGASTLASQEFDEQAANKRPAVQVGDPFEEKLLIEVCLQLLKAGKFVALGDLGAAGLTSSASEMASRGGVGIEIDVTRVPQRELAMQPFEIMVSESQERMLAVVTPNDLQEVLDTAAMWGVRATVIGRITDTGRFIVTEGEKVVANMPADKLADDAPRYSPAAKRPTYLDEIAEMDPYDYILNDPTDMTGELKLMLQLPNIASRRWIYEQYDHQVQNNTVVLPGADAAVIRVGLPGRETADAPLSNRGIAASADCNARFCYMNPRVGAQIALAEGMRNLACVGAKPLAITDCLCFGNPENPEIFYTFKEAVEGLAEACKHTKIPVVSGNVSFYNETLKSPIYPSPLIGMVGVVEDISTVKTLAFKNEDDLIVVLGETKDELGGSEYAHLRVGVGAACGKVPELDLDEELALCDALREMVTSNVVTSAHDISEGGLAVALSEMAIAGKIGCRVAIEHDFDLRSTLFGESQGRAIVTVSPEHYDKVVDIATKHGVSLANIGTVGGDVIAINENCELDLVEATDLFMNALERSVQGKTVIAQNG